MVLLKPNQCSAQAAIAISNRCFDVWMRLPRIVRSGQPARVEARRFRRPGLDAPAHSQGRRESPASSDRRPHSRATSFRIVYIPKPGSDVNIKIARKGMAPYRALFDTPNLRDQLNTVRRPDSTVVLSCGAKPGEDTLWFTWFQLYRLQAFELFLDDR